MENNKYTFFWKDKSPFSQWHNSGFTVDGVHYKTAEHWMMWKKAMLFGDTSIAEQVLKASHPRDVKKFGRQVSNFIKETWEKECQDFVYQGNFAKFTQNPELLKVLMATEGTELCEASPYDAIWGCGLTEEDAKKISPDKWPGTNYLGRILTKLREDLKKNEIQS